jgi:hypothetical protein
VNRSLKSAARQPVNGARSVNGELQNELMGGKVSAQRVKQALWNRFNPLRNLTPETLARQLDSYQCGYLKEIAITWEAIERRDAMVKNVASKRKKSVARNGWEILTLPNLAAADEAEAEKHKAALEFFYNNLSATAVLEQNERGGLSLLLRQMMDGVGKRFAVHEIVWRPVVQRDAPPGRSGSSALPDSAADAPVPTTMQLTAEFRFVPLWFFENRTGKLRFLESDASIDGSEMRDGDWLVTVGDGIMEACSVCYMFKNLPLKDWLALSEKFGMPGLVGKTDAAKGTEEWDALVDALANFGQDWAVVMNRSAEVTPLEASVGGTNIPQPPLVEYMDRMMASLWRGADLGTIAKGQEAVGASLQEDESDILLEDDLMLCEEALAEQVSKFCIRYLFGADRPLAYIKLRRPQKKNIDQDIKVDEFLVRHGVPVGIDETLERYERSQPEEGEATLQTSRDMQSGEIDPDPDGEVSNEETPGEVPRVHVNRLAAAFAEDLQPLRQRIERILSIEDPDLLRSKLQALVKQLPALLKDLNADPESARVLEDALQRGVLAGASSRKGKP